MCLCIQVENKYKKASARRSCRDYILCKLLISHTVFLSMLLFLIFSSFLFCLMCAQNNFLFIFIYIQYIFARVCMYAYCCSMEYSCITWKSQCVCVCVWKAYKALKPRDTNLNKINVHIQIHAYTHTHLWCYGKSNFTWHHIYSYYRLQFTLASILSSSHSPSHIYIHAQCTDIYFLWPVRMCERARTWVCVCSTTIYFTLVRC